VPHSNRLFLSQPGNRYREAVELRTLFAHQQLDAEDWPCGAAFGDLNRDGRLDLVVSAHYRQARNRVFLNEGLRQGLPQFREITREAGLADIVPARCPHVEIQDFDNDGWPDIQELNPGCGYASGQAALCHFGLAAETAVDLLVNLPNGREIRRPRIATNQRLNLDEP